LAEIIRAFLSEDGVVVDDQDTNSVVVRDTGGGVETAIAIIKALDIPKARKHRHEPREREEHEEDEAEARENVFFGQLLKKQDRSISIRTRDGQEEVNLFIPIREDGKLVDDFAEFIDQLEIGAMIKVRWQWRNEQRWLRRLEHFKPERED
jgi:type II secretory pathway component GspD/PulD (secretin)